MFGRGGLVRLRRRFKAFSNFQLMVSYKRGIKRDQYYIKIPRRHSFNDKHASGIVLKQCLKYFQIFK